jgi:hypothetical protein
MLVEFDREASTDGPLFPQLIQGDKNLAVAIY